LRRGGLRAVVFWFALVGIAGLIVRCHPTPEQERSPQAFADTLRRSLHEDVMALWYPRAIDSTYGGYRTHFAHDWTPLDPQRKFVVTQARHLWTTARMHEAAPRNDSLYLRAARHGARFLQNEMWDEDQGGFYSLVDRQGSVLNDGGAYTATKTAYGNAFAIYGLARYYAATGDTSALRLAQRAFRWLEMNAHDKTYAGYFRNLHRDGTPYPDGYDAETPSKSQNSTIHLLEAFTTLYEVAPETPRLRDRLEELLVITRDTMTTDRGTLQLFYERDWTPISYQDSSMAVRRTNVERDHVSFGHDVETAFLMLEATEALGREPDSTLAVGTRMVNHALKYGWDSENGGLHDGGLVVGPDSVHVAQSSKEWWVQAEALHTFVLMDERRPDGRYDYGARARATWNYIDRFLIDAQHGGWHVYGLDETPEARTRPKATIWKATYHNSRALLRSIEMLED
jgi:mannobiose 2-epimerase